ncbi:MAG: hypothetical protein ABJC62_08005 [Frankiaceae bacterium]
MTAQYVRPTREARFAGPPAEGPPPPSRRIPWLPLAAAGVIAVLAAVLLGRLVVAGGEHRRLPQARPTAGAAVPAASPAGQVLRWQGELARYPGQPALLTNLGLAYLARAKETADPSFYALADRALSQSFQMDSGDLRTMVGTALLQLSRHDFRAALALGRRAAAAYPSSADALGVVVDSQVELGRYADADRSAQQMVNLRPNTASFARISYLRELQGDSAGAVTAMSQAVTAGGGNAQDVAYVQTLVGDLERQRGNAAEARTAYASAVGSVPAYGPAEFGLARLDAAGGRLAAAAARLAPLVSRLPLPETVAFYGDVLAAQGRDAAARAQYELVRQIEKLQQANGVVVDYESARFEGDHARDPGVDQARAVSLARAAYAARPTIYGADVQAWALRQAGSPRAALRWANSALRFSTQDALLWWHRAAISADLGAAAQARRDLRTALRINPAFSVRDSAAVRTLANRLGVAVPR